MKENSNKQVFNILTGVAFVSILIPILFWALWIYCCNEQTDHMERVKMYNSYFPEFMTGRYTISFISLLLSLLGLILSITAHSKANSSLKPLNLSLIIVGGIMMMLTLFSLM